ncbi:poly(ADP-ribose) glycohydrolase isoform X2 [Cryptotermes secundus]|uniref:poly(ADP-ribose) glycohydrolase isoform X2 n=1 Tax=Cryptotermes secundus TaxID=105785 RepID=UPI000CD7D941|nr:poly(ADP-ribose) glycohydrolase isoform X2 [Cryptotermes secundus]
MRNHHEKRRGKNIMESVNSDMLSESLGSEVKAECSDNSPDMLSENSVVYEETSVDVKTQIEGDNMPENENEVLRCGATLDEIRNGSAPCLPPVIPSHDHTVFFQLPIVTCGQPPKPHPDNLRDSWDTDHVRMPFSKHSLYPVQEGGEQSQLRQRWELVQEALLKTIMSCQQLEAVILSYNSKYSERWDFLVLQLLFTEVFSEDETSNFFSTLLPQIIQLALQLPTLLTAPVPLLVQHRNHTLSFSQLQIASLLANAFLCTFPRRNTAKRQSEYARYPDINFNRLFQAAEGAVPKPEKLKCLLHYFRRVCSRAPDGVVTYARRYVNHSDLPQWDKSQKLLTKLHITSQGTIEDDGEGLLQVDFANKRVGGGVLGRGCVQEEIRFVICPELIAARLFTEALDSTEALLVVGCERFSNYTGYSNTFEWKGNYEDMTPRDSSGRRMCSIVAIDALKLGNRNVQYTPSNMHRELNKAYVGFHCPEFQPGERLAGVASGNWGCGAYRGDAKLKTLLQLMAASQAGRHLAYFTFGDAKLRDQVYHLYTYLTDHQVTVGQLWRLLCKYYEHSFRGGRLITELYPFLYQALSNKSNPVGTTSASFALSARHIGTRPRGEGNNECKWLNKNRGALNDKELEDALAALPVDSDNCNARKSENESPFKCIKLRETCGSSYVNQGSVGKQQDTVATSDKQKGTLLQYLEQCDTNSSLTARSPIPKRKISDYFAAAPRPK